LDNQSCNTKWVEGEIFKMNEWGKMDVDGMGVLCYKYLYKNHFITQHKKMYTMCIE
jgi:NAD-dependent DNA ligase